MFELEFKFLSCLLIISSGLFAQPVISFQKCYGTSGTDYFADAIITNDNGFASVVEFGGVDGFMEFQDSLVYPATFMKFDSNLDLEWVKNFGGSAGSGFLKLFQKDNGDYILGGLTSDIDGDFSDNHGSLDLMLVKTDSNGNKLWSKCYGSPGFENFESFLPTQDGGYLISGYSSSSGGDIPYHYGDGFSYDALIMKTDSEGNTEWVKVFGGSSDDSPLGNIIEIKRGYYILHIGAHSDDYDLAGSGFIGDKRWIIKLDSLGNIVADTIYSGVDDLNTFNDDEIILLNNKMYLAGAANPGTDLFPGVTGIGGLYDGGIATYDENLNFTSLNIFGGSLLDILKRIEVDEFNNYYFLGYSLSNDFDLPGNYNNQAASDYWLLKTDSNFNLLWSKNFGGSDPCGDLACSGFKGEIIVKGNLLYGFIKNVVPEILPDFDIACGLLGTGNTDAWIVVFDLTTEINNMVKPKSEYLIYPNPANNEITIQNNTNGLNYSISILDVFGHNIYFEDNVTSPSHIIYLSNYLEGIYFISIENCDGTIFNSKIIFHI